MLRLNNLLNIFAIAALMLIVSPVSAQFKAETFASFKKMGAQPDLPQDFKTTFQPKAQIYVQFTFPNTPSSYEAECYWIDNGQEKMRGSAVWKNFEKDGRPKKVWGNLGMMYDEGEYRLIIKNDAKEVVAETKFVIAGAVASSSIMPKATITICDDTDDNLKPIKPVTNGTINKGDGVNLQAKLDKGIGARFFIWSIYQVNDAGQELPWKDWQVDVANEKYTLFATDSKTYFTVPGKYVIYMLPQNGTNTGTTIGNHDKYYGKTSLVVK